VLELVLPDVIEEGGEFARVGRRILRHVLRLHRSVRAMGTQLRTTPLNNPSRQQDNPNSLHEKFTPQCARRDQTSGPCQTLENFTERNQLFNRLYK
jgi:hypothetical protein